MKTVSLSSHCPCLSKKSYEKCCKPYHDGKEAENALILMRSRYSAYALCLTDYIIKTTDPKNPAYQKNTQEKWREEILTFCHNTLFMDLKILAFEESPNNATVIFTAHLQAKEQNKDISFTEKSSFNKSNDHWLYESGELLP